MLIDSQEGAGEAAFQATDNIVKVTEANGIPDLYSQFQQLPATPDSSFGMVPDATIAPDGISFNAQPTVGMENALSQVIPGLDGIVSSFMNLPGGAGLMLSFFQALGALFAGIAQSFTMTATQLSQMYAQAAQSAIDMTKMARN